MTKNEFPFIIGYHGDSALLDKHFRAQYKNKTARQLTDEGQYKAAYCLTLLEGTDEDRNYIAQQYNKTAGSSYEAADLERLFGVFTIPEVKTIRPL